MPIERTNVAELVIDNAFNSRQRMRVAKDASNLVICDYKWHLSLKLESSSMDDEAVSLPVEKDRPLS